VVPLAPRMDAPIDDGHLACSSETRIGLFDFSRATRTEPLRYVSGSSHRASIVSSCEATSDLDLYTQPDPLDQVRYSQDSFAYAKDSPVGWVDPLGLESSCSNCCPTGQLGCIDKRRTRINNILNTLESTGHLPIGKGTSAGALTGCGALRDASGNYAGVMYFSSETITGPKDCGCVRCCGEQHEKVHRQQCQRYGPFRFVDMGDLGRERPAYLTELGCLLSLLRSVGAY
jgi:hypothetical protein